MGKKPSKQDDDDDGPPPSSGPPSIGQQTAGIANKMVRSKRYHKLKHEKSKKKKQERKKREREEDKLVAQGKEPPPKKVPKTIENTREADETIAAPDDEEVAADEAQDEFAAHFARDRPPNVLLTTCYKPSGIMYKFLAEMLEVLPAATYYKRRGFPLKKIVEFASARDYTDLMVFNEDRGLINGLLLVHLPDGPTARFRLSSLVLGADIKGHGRASAHRPELVLNNFDTRLGRRLGRMLASLFHQDPAFRGRRVATFHNQRDFVFFRHHRYIFEEKDVTVPAKRKGEKKHKETTVKARLQELGPRFTLRLCALQRGTPGGGDGGEFEWLKKADTEGGRRKFNL